MATVVFLSHRIPYPPNKGDKIRSWHILQHLAAHHDVHLAAFVDDPDDMQYKPVLEAICQSVYLVERSPLMSKLHGLKGLLSGRSITDAAYDSSAMRKFVGSLQGHNPDFIFCFSLGVLQHAKALNSVPVLLDLVDVDSAKWESYSQQALFPLSWVYAREGRVLKHEENQSIQKAAATLLVSEDEAQLARNRLDTPEKGATIQALKNGVDCDYLDPKAINPAAGQPCDIIFMGAMDYAPNIEAVCWFVEEIFPIIRSEHADCSFLICGGRPTAKVKALAAKGGVIVSGNVPEIRHWIGQAKICVAPMLTARGIQNKVLEGMAMAKPVVTTTAGYLGIEAPEGNGLFVENDPQGFADQVNGLLTDADSCKKEGMKARQWVQAHFAWDAVYRQLDHCVDQLMAAGEDK